MSFIDVLSAALDAGTAVGLILVFFWFVAIPAYRYGLTLPPQLAIPPRRLHRKTNCFEVVGEYSSHEDFGLEKHTAAFFIARGNIWVRS
jgi:hypothetical protein